MQKHNYFIDMLRFFAALIVVLFHLNQAIPSVDNWYRNTIKYGWLGVPIFFVISGYCIILSAYNSSNFKDFLSRRFFRIFPAYWFSIIIVILAACFQKIYIGTNAVHDIPRTIGGALATLTLTTTPFTSIKTLNWVYWTLTYELFFYLTICLALAFKKSNIIYILIAVSILNNLLPLQATGSLFFLNQWPVFGLGLCIYYYFKCSGILSWVCFSILLLANLVPFFTRQYQTCYIVTIFITALVIILSHYVNLKHNLLATLGQYSYSVYLIHVPIGVFILGLFESSYVQKHAPLNFIYDLIIYLFISGLAWLMYNWVEKPSIAYGRKISQKYFNADSKKHTG